MTEVAFHAGLPDKLAYACRLLRKASRQGARVTVTGSADVLRQLDVQLWVFEPGSFVAHALLAPGQAPAPALQRTPIWLAEDAEAAPSAPILVNLGPAAPAQPGRYERVIELVGADAPDAALGRQRWRRYLAAGLTPVLHPSPGAS